MQNSGLRRSISYGLAVIFALQLLRLSGAAHDESACPWKLTTNETIECKDDIRATGECSSESWLDCYETGAEGCPESVCTEAHRKKFALPIYKMVECLPSSGTDFCKDVASRTCIGNTLTGDNEFKLEAFTDPDQTLASLCMKLNAAKMCLEDTLDGVTQYFTISQTDVCSRHTEKVHAILEILNPVYLTSCGEGTTAENVCPNGGDIADLPHVDTEGEHDHKLEATTKDVDTEGEHDHKLEATTKGSSGSSTLQVFFFTACLSLITVLRNL